MGSVRESFDSLPDQVDSPPVLLHSGSGSVQKSGNSTKGAVAAVEKFQNLPVFAGFSIAIGSVRGCGQGGYNEFIAFSGWLAGFMRFIPITLIM